MSPRRSRAWRPARATPAGGMARSSWSRGSGVGLSAAGVAAGPAGSGRDGPLLGTFREHHRPPAAAPTGPSRVRTRRRQQASGVFGVGRCMRRGPGPAPNVGDRGERTRIPGRGRGAKRSQSGRPSDETKPIPACETKPIPRPPKQSQSRSVRRRSASWDCAHRAARGRTKGGRSGSLGARASGPPGAGAPPQGRVSRGLSHGFAPLLKTWAPRVWVPGVELRYPTEQHGFSVASDVGRDRRVPLAVGALRRASAGGA